VLVNLAPADLLKEGSHFDLPIALACSPRWTSCRATKRRASPHSANSRSTARIMPVAGRAAGSIGAGARELGLVCPAAQGGEAAWAGTDGGAGRHRTCGALINHFRGRQLLSHRQRRPRSPPAPRAGPCLSEVRGQEAPSARWRSPPPAGTTCS
jgi:magnesium chelatase family protein